MPAPSFLSVSSSAALPSLAPAFASSSSSPAAALPSILSSLPEKMPLGPHFEENASLMLGAVKAKLASHGIAWPAQWPDPESFRPAAAAPGGHGGRPAAPAAAAAPMMADMRPVTTSMSEVLFGLTGAPGGGHGGRPAAPAVVNPVEVWTGLPWTPQAISGWLEFAKMMLPTFLLCGFGYAPANACGAFILGSTMRGLGTVGKDILGVQTPMEKMGKARKKGRCADTLPPAPPPPPIPPPLPSAYETRGVNWKGHLLLPNQFPPRGAVLTGKSTAAKSAALWPNAWSPSSPLRPQRNDLDITADEAAAAKAYALGDSRGELATSSYGEEGGARAEAAKAAEAEAKAKAAEAKENAQRRWGKIAESIKPPPDLSSIVTDAVDKSKRNDVSKMDSKELSFGGVGLGLSKLLAGGKSAREKVEEEKEVMDD